MSHKNLKLCLVLLLGVGLTGLQAQESINSTGENASGNGGTASYSVGQIFYTTNTGTNCSATQGVQQPYEIFVFTAIEEAIGINLSLIAYPNPTKDYITLDFENFDLSNLKYQLYDNNGKLLQSQIITSNKTNIIVSNLVPANYFVKVIQGNKELKVFKIIKN